MHQRVAARAKQGVWTIQINYTGHPAFGGNTPQVTVVEASGAFCL
jgi:hypothetical protein